MENHAKIYEKTAKRANCLECATGSKINMELLAPAGGMEQLQAAVRFGADAVYLAADRFGMRARAANFALEDIPKAVEYAHAHGVKVHVTCNVLMLPDDIDALPPYLRALDAAGVDALIIGDMGAFALAREHAPHVDLHVSTQASVANAAAARVWHSLGARRVVCAREMSLSDIARLRQDAPPDLEIEAFVHGAMCMAVSGRCLISSYLTGRSGNKGHCTQPCRWSYQLGKLAEEDGLPAEGTANDAARAYAENAVGTYVEDTAGLHAEEARKGGLAAKDACGVGVSLALEEEKRPGEFFPIEQDGRGTFIMNAKDLNMVAHLRELEAAGVSSIKIEGRNKKAFYVASVVNAYRRALDGAPLEEVERELLDVSHRPYNTGFYFAEAEQAPDYDGYEQQTMHVADVVKCKVVGGVEGRLAGGEAATDAGKADAGVADAGEAYAGEAGTDASAEEGTNVSREAFSHERGVRGGAVLAEEPSSVRNRMCDSGCVMPAEAKIAQCVDVPRVILYARCRNRFAEGEALEVLAPRVPVRTVRVRNLTWLPDPTEDDPAPAPVPVPVANRSCNLYRFEARFDSVTDGAPGAPASAAASATDDAFDAPALAAASVSSGMPDDKASVPLEAPEASRNSESLEALFIPEGSFLRIRKFRRSARHE